MCTMKSFRFIGIALSAAIALLLITCSKQDNPPADCPDCPAISALTPNFGSPGDTVTISGKNFGGLESVTFDGQPAVTLDGPDFTTLMSAGFAPSGVETMDELLPEFGSAVALETVAVFWIGFGVV